MVRVDQNVVREGEAPSGPCDRGSDGAPSPPNPSIAGDFLGALARIGRLGTLLLLASMPAGCANVTSPLAQWRAAYDGNLYKKISPEEMADASGPADSTNLLQRWLSPKTTASAPGGTSPTTSLVLGSNGWRPMAKSAPNPEADAEFDAALKLFKQGKFSEAEKQFAKIAKNRKGSTWGENGQYYVAESQYHQKHYIDAHDSLDKLFTDYPATAYLDKLVAREYELAQLWLAQTDPNAPPEKKLPWY
ncbi:MAG: tetratricopeptide repeat protein, partial [Isosphaeraceae bacterium]